MKVTFISNYINHHQIPLSNALYELLEGDYHFIQTEPMEEDRVKMGWGAEVDNIPYVIKYYENEKECQQLLLDSDVVIFGGVDDESYIKPRLEKGLLTVRYFERIYKTGQWRRFSPKGLMKKYNDHIRYRKQDVYLLCAGGYVADDFHLIKAYPDKMLKWGYFPENYKYDIETLLAKKQENEVPKLLWTGRMLWWKHPEYAVLLAKELKEKGYKFKLDLVGDGEMKESLANMVKEFSLEEEVLFYDFMPPKMIRKKMEDANIYLMTSDRMEGWGAVVNEAMNAGCCVVASHMVGATPYLIQHKKNGLIFESGNMQSLVACVTKILNNNSYQKKLGENAYKTIDETWNAKEAAKRFVQFCKTKDLTTYMEGPCAKAQPVREYKMYKKLTGN